MGLLENKYILITGMSNKYSIAYGIAKAMYREGANLAFTYQNDKLKYKVKKLANNFNSNIVLKCDVSKNKNIIDMFNTLNKYWNYFDGFIHSIAYAPNKQINGNYIDKINKKGFILSHVISSYSFVAMAKICKHMLRKYSSLVTITYIGSKIITPNYNVMGLAKASLESNTRYMAYYMGKYNNIRVNAISAGLIKTVSSLGIKNFKEKLLNYELLKPIRYKISTEDIGNVATFLCSNLSLGITGEIINVDGGFHITSAPY